jgi:hypothetical protein
MYLQRQLSEQAEHTVYIDLEDSHFVALLDRGVDEFLNYSRGEGIDLGAYAQTSRKLFVLVDEVQYLAVPFSFRAMLAFKGFFFVPGIPQAEIKTVSCRLSI